MEQKEKVCNDFDSIDYDNPEIITRLQSALAVLKRKTAERKAKQASNDTTLQRVYITS